MNIALIGPTYPFRGGIAHYTTLLCQALRQKHRVSFYAFKSQYPLWMYPGRSDKDPSQQPIQVENAIRSLAPLNPLSWWHVAKMIQYENPDLIIFPWWVPFWAPAFWSIIRLLRMKKNIPVLFLCHNVLPHENFRLATLLCQMTFKQSDYFIVHTEEEKRHLLELIPTAQVKQTPHPTYAIFGETDITRDKARAALRLEGDVILFFGFVREYKGIKYLLNALPLVMKEHPVTLLIVGEFWQDVNEYKQTIENLDLNNAVYIIDSYVPNEAVAQYFLAADLVVLPYVNATGSGVAQIALGLGRPLVVTALPGLKDLVKDGVTGYLVPPSDSRRLAEAILKYFKEADRIKFQHNIAMYNETFSWKNIVNTVESFVSKT
jgi:glycosyltransferase involved in cell wall biosynthesis